MRVRQVVGCAALAVVLAAGCKRKAAPPRMDIASSDKPVAQPRLGGDDDQPRISFKIDKVHEQRRPSDQPPWHAAGGDWTFFDAETVDGQRFGFGWQQPSVSGSKLATFGKAMLTVPNAEAGARLVDAFARVFKGELPPAARHVPLKIVPISLAFLARNTGRSGEGFSGDGTWTATKLFLQRPGIEAEVFFNFDLQSKQGEFAEKDSDYADDLLAFLARDLRDGPRPARTPENDQRITLVGPKLEAWSRIGDPGASFYHFEAGGKRIVYWLKQGARTRVMSVSITDPKDKAEIANLAHTFSGMRCAPVTDDPCLIEESVPKEPEVSSSEDPRTFFLAHRAKKTLRRLSGEWRTKGAVLTAPVSPDGAFVAVGSWHPKSKPPGNYRSLHFLPAGVPADDGIALKIGEEQLDVIGWTGKGPDLRAVVSRGAKYDQDAKLSYLLVDPRQGAQKDLKAPPPGISTSEESKVSPDGKRRVSCKNDEEIIITDVATGATKRFAVDPEERRAFGTDCEVTWASPRYLHFSAERPAFIDVETLELSYPFGEGNEPEGITYDPTLSWAVTTTDSGLEVARVVVR